MGGDNMTVGEKLQILRGNKSQTEVAESVGISSSTLSMYEQNKRSPRDEIKVRISKYYGVSVGDLFYSSENHDS